MFTKLSEVILTYLSITVVPVFIPVLFDPRGQGLLFNHCLFSYLALRIYTYSAHILYSASHSRRIQSINISFLRYAPSDFAIIRLPQLPPELPIDGS